MSNEDVNILKNIYGYRVIGAMGFYKFSETLDPIIYQGHEAVELMITPVIVSSIKTQPTLATTTPIGFATTGGNPNYVKVYYHNIDKLPTVTKNTPVENAKIKNLEEECAKIIKENQRLHDTLRGDKKHNDCLGDWTAMREAYLKVHNECEWLRKENKRLQESGLKSVETITYLSNDRRELKQRLEKVRSALIQVLMSQPRNPHTLAYEALSIISNDGKEN